MVHARRVIVYVNRTGCPWRYLPNEFPPWRTVYGYSARCCGTCPAAAPASGRPGLLQDTPASSPPGPPAWRFSWRSSASATHTPSRCCPAAGSSSAP